VKELTEDEAIAGADTLLTRPLTSCFPGRGPCRVVVRPEGLTHPVGDVTTELVDDVLPVGSGAVLSESYEVALGGCQSRDGSAEARSTVAALTFRPSRRRCYVCDGAADPTKPHRVYLFHFPVLACFKVGLTHAGNNRRLEVHTSNGGRLVDVVQVANRAAAYALERAVLLTTRDYPSTAGPADFPHNGWTETWADHAPPVHLADLAARLAPVDVPAEVVAAWAARTGPAAAAGLPAVAAGDVVVFTGADQTPREQWHTVTAAAGLRTARAVTAGVALLVAADPQRPTSKVLAAGRLGIPVVNYPTFVDVLDRAANPGHGITPSP